MTFQRHPKETRSTGKYYREMVRMAQVAESYDIDSIWVSEHHFLDDDYASGVFPLAGTIAGATDQIQIGTSVALAPLHDAVRLAEDAATVDLVSGDRFVLGLGLGYRDEEFDNFGVDKSERAPRMEDTVALLRDAWTSDSLEHTSEFHPIEPGTNVTPKPDRQLPIILAGGAKPAVRRAARDGDGWLALPTESPKGVRKRREDIETVRAAENITREFTIYPGARGFVAESREEAWEHMKDGYFYTIRTYEEFFRGESIQRLSPEFRAKEKDRAVFGSPEEVIEQLEQYERAAGEDAHFVFRIFHPGIDSQTLEHCIRLIGEEIRPHFVS
jgi:alkanesulfonate monooxygenase SsuD/methylene tetrahydromethanopterin reductase-like flavin-dependent oxidoreductase (luciferase family)